MDKGWKLEEIDKADIFYLVEIYLESDEEEERGAAIQYADEVPWL